jgi:hypothetical protein
MPVKMKKMNIDTETWTWTRAPSMDIKIRITRKYVLSIHDIVIMNLSVIPTSGKFAQ